MLQSIESVFCSSSVAWPPQRKSTTDKSTKRYTLTVVKNQGQVAALRVFDRQRDCFFLDWSGAVVYQLRDSGALPTELMRAGYCDCDKSTIWHLILAGAVIQRTLDQIGHSQAEYSDAQEVRLTWPAHMPSVSRERPDSTNKSFTESLSERILRLSLPLAGPHKLLARLLFAKPGQHFSVEDVTCLFLMECPSLVFGEARLAACLDELAGWDVIQRIEVNGENVFYDINTSPHLHVYNSRTRELRDANLHGILHVDAEASNSSLELIANAGVVAIR